MPSYAKFSDVPSIYYDLITGYAIGAKQFFDYYYYRQSFVVYSVIFAIVSMFIVLGLSTPLYVTISESIKTTDKGKPKLYYHFWSSVLLIVIGVWIYSIIYHLFRPPIQDDQLYIAMFVVMIISSLFGVFIAFSTVAKERGKAHIFSVPLLECCCHNGRCMVIWSCFMTMVGFFVTLSFVVYLLYAIPTIVFVYYLYPTRTLIRVPFIIGAIFYTITLTSLVLYLFEKFTVTVSSLLRSENNIEYIPLKNSGQCSYGASGASPSSTPSDIHHAVAEHSQPCTQCLHVEPTVIQKVHAHNWEHYKQKLDEDLKIITDRCRFIISVLQLSAGLTILAAYICAEVILANLVFKQTNVTGIDSLLALFPTLIFSVFTWFGRGLIFDVREDMQDVSIPYFKKKETTKEKLLREIKEELQNIYIQIGQKAETINGDGCGKATANNKGVNEEGGVTDTVHVMAKVHESTVDRELSILAETPKLDSATP